MTSALATGFPFVLITRPRSSFDGYTFTLGNILTLSLRRAMFVNAKVLAYSGFRISNVTNPLCGNPVTCNTPYSELLMSLFVSIEVVTSPIVKVPDRRVRIGRKVTSTKRVAKVTEADSPTQTSVKSLTSAPEIAASNRPSDRATTAMSSELDFGIRIENGFPA